jgi:flagellin-specific chaperone FliS
MTQIEAFTLVNVLLNTEENEERAEQLLEIADFISKGLSLADVMKCQNEAARKTWKTA